MALEPITRAEQIMSGKSLEPITREEMFLAKAAGMDVNTPEPITRREMFLSKISGGGGVAINNQDKTITQNGTYTADEGYTGLGNVEVRVPTSLGDNVAKGIIDGTITELSDSSIREIKAYTFYSRLNLQTADFPGVTRVGEYAFEACSSLKTVNLQNATTVGVRVFFGCAALEAADVRKSVSISEKLFSNCFKLESVNCQSATTISNSGFASCPALTTIDLPAVGSIDTYGFYGCKNLTTIVLRKTSAICSLKNINALQTTPFASDGTGGTVYVPAALIESYQTATNWSTLYAAGNCNFVAIEGSEYE